MDYSTYFANLQKKVAEAQAAVQAAANESGEKLKARVNQAHADASASLDAADFGGHGAERANRI